MGLDGATSEFMCLTKPEVALHGQEITNGECQEVCVRAMPISQAGGCADVGSQHSHCISPPPHAPAHKLRTFPKPSSCRPGSGRLCVQHCTLHTLTKDSLTQPTPLFGERRSKGSPHEDPVLVAAHSTHKVSKR